MGCWYRLWNDYYCVTSESCEERCRNRVMLLNMSELLQIAQREKFAVPAFNIGNHEIFKGVFKTAVSTNSPVILEIHPDELEYLGDEYILTLRSSYEG